MTAVDGQALHYDLHAWGVALFPRLTAGCFWCTDHHEPDGCPPAPSSCPVSLHAPRSRPRRQRMTRRAQPIRHRTWTTGNTDASQPDPLDVAHAEVDDARAQVQAARRAVSARTAGASSLAVAEWRLAKALDRLAELNGSPPPGFPPVAGPADAA